ncbi:uncharacterized protein LOC118197109 [Stegodyphus dumicola]|uniref:uncharacterized protein LOC118197109 n=1 Tax=Stegodyphus dumicola TaxID=202533 RepID=UPI0015B166CC|nr:uncharacterized protein LOC118197109 [Stegodyphus dumicola]
MASLSLGIPSIHVLRYRKLSLYTCKEVFPSFVDSYREGRTGIGKNLKPLELLPTIATHFFEARKDEIVYLPPDESPDGLYTSTLILTFKATSGHFWSGRMKLVCEAIISQAHTLRSKEILISNNATTHHGTVFTDYGAHKDGPIIKGGKSNYDIGDIVDINCTASKSQPPAELHWYINDKEAKPKYLIPREPITYTDGMISTVLGLQFQVKHRHFQRNEMRLRCTATLSEVKKMTSEPLEAEISEQQMSDLHVDFNTGAVSSGSLWCYTSFNQLWISFTLTLFSRTAF